MDEYLGACVRSLTSNVKMKMILALLMLLESIRDDNFVQTLFFSLQICS